MKRVLTVALAIAMAASVGVGVAMARAGGTQFVVRTQGSENFEKNALVYATLRFAPQVIQVPTGGTLLFVKRDDAPDEPHTLSIVTKGQLPTSIDEVFNCIVCNKILGEHFPPNSQPVLKVDRDGDGGLNADGDSIMVLPGVNTKISVVITAPAGTTLHYLCAFHPWMQATIQVTS